jgi:hypothetical protein
LFCVPVYAAWSLLPLETAPGASMNDHHAVVTPRTELEPRPAGTSPRVPAISTSDADHEVMVTDWTFAGKGQPSPYQ